MDEILKNSTKVRDLLSARSDRPMTPEEFNEQRTSYVVGNAFDAFIDSNTINRSFIEGLQQKRLEVA
jgi:hypothetical protein